MSGPSVQSGAPLALLMAAIVGYCVFSTAEVVLIKSLDKMAVVLPVLSCLCENAYWPAQGLMYRSLRRRSADARPNTWKTARGYIVIGCVASATSLLRCVGINGLPGSVYVVASCSDVIFNTLLNKICLKKHFLDLHYAAVLLTCVALTVLTQSKEASTMDHHHILQQHNATRDLDASGKAQRSDVTQTLVPLLAVLASALCSAGNSVLSDFLFSKDTQKGLLACTEASFYNSLIPCCVMPIVMFATGEFRRYEPEWNRLESVSPLTPWLACALGAGLAMAKMFDRLSKFTIIQSRNSFFFAILDAFRRMGTGLVSVWMFNEALTAAKLLAFALTTTAIIANSLGDSHLKRKKAMSQQTESLLNGTVESQSNPFCKANDVEMVGCLRELHPEEAQAAGCSIKPRSTPSALDRFYMYIASF